jgi:hypothetical protein
MLAAWARSDEPTDAAMSTKTKLSVATNRSIFLPLAFTFSDLVLYQTSLSFF